MASIAQRRDSERRRLNVLVSAFKLSDQRQVNASAPLLGRGNTLHPLPVQSATEGAKLAARMHPLGSAMYIPAAGGVISTAAAAPPCLSWTLASAAAGGAAVPAAAQAVPAAAVPAGAVPAAAQAVPAAAVPAGAVPAAAVPAAAVPAAAAATPVTWPAATASKSAASASVSTQGEATSRGPAGSSRNQTTGSSATDASLSRVLCGNSFPEEVVRVGLPGRSASANRILHPRRRAATATRIHAQAPSLVNGVAKMPVLAPPLRQS